jgi:hypothetical protein
VAYSGEFVDVETGEFDKIAVVELAGVKVVSEPAAHILVFAA